MHFYLAGVVGPNFLFATAIGYQLLVDLMLLFLAKMSSLFLYWFLCHFMIDLCNPISGQDTVVR